MGLAIPRMSSGACRYHSVSTGMILPLFLIDNVIA